MAYSNETTTTNNTKNKAPALGFINIHRPIIDLDTGEVTGKVKMGYLALDANDPEQVKYCEILKANPELVHKLLANLVVDFRENVKKEQEVARTTEDVMASMFK